MLVFLRPRYLALTACLLLSGCFTHSHSTRFNGVQGLRGTPIEYQTTSSYGVKLLFTFNLWGKTGKADVIDAFTAEAASRGGERVRISQTSSSIYWYIFPPISFFIHPVVTSVEGDVEGGIE